MAVPAEPATTTRREPERATALIPTCRGRAILMTPPRAKWPFGAPSGRSRASVDPTPTVRPPAALDVAPQVVSELPCKPGVTTRPFRALPEARSGLPRGLRP